MNDYPAVADFEQGKALSNLQLTGRASALGRCGINIARSEVSSPPAAREPIDDDPSEATRLHEQASILDQVFRLPE